MVDAILTLVRKTSRVGRGCQGTLGGGELLLLDNYQELVKAGVTAEQEILTRHFCYFGPVTEGLVKRVEVEDWCHNLKLASATADRALKEQPELRFERWSEDLGPEAQDMIAGMTNMDPTARTTIDQILAHPWWQLDE
ncbi:kinase-like protein [Parachaetomium inaequale]|uniref:Kinase-like protein n=1 Tax=Parachaetomium inaequale TaxID=2588326 RepID=A0AAN6PGP7_9PEZI|nr:kinase-like protein [Parachaetomium inaequale]